MPASYGQSPWARCICGAPVFFCLDGVRHLLCVLVPRPPLRGKLDIIDVRDTPSFIDRGIRGIQSECQPLGRRSTVVSLIW